VVFVKKTDYSEPNVYIALNNSADIFYTIRQGDAEGFEENGRTPNVVIARVVGTQPD
jgi:hypothetical protein